MQLQPVEIIRRSWRELRDTRITFNGVAIRYPGLKRDFVVLGSTVVLAGSPAKEPFSVPSSSSSATPSTSSNCVTSEDIGEGATGS